MKTPSGMELTVTMVPIDQVTPYEKNPRHNEQAVDAVVKSIREFGWRQPVVVDTNHVIIVGHTRWKAAKAMGLTEIPVHIADLPPEKARAYRIADNQTGAIATWDFELLGDEIKALQTDGFDISLLGFSELELSGLGGQTTGQGQIDPDSVPAPPDQAVTQPGDLWVLGNHRLLCGDAGKAEDVDRLLGGQPIHLINSDPPYNVKVEPRSNNAIAAGLSSFTATGVSASRELHNQRFLASQRQKNDEVYRSTDIRRGSLPTQLRTPHGDAHHGLKHHQAFDLARRKVAAHKTTEKLRAKDRPLANDFVSDEAFDQMLLAWFGNMSRVLLPGRSFYIWGGYANLGNYPGPLQKVGLYFSQGIVWDKQWPVLTRKDFMGAFEIAFYGWKEGAGHKFYGPNNVADLWHVKKIPPQQMEHLTAKPAELAVRAMQYSSQPGENVLDLFGGSGSTLIGAEQTGRHAYLMEIDPLYCDLVADRYQRFTGKPAVLERTGNSPIPMGKREEGMR